MNREQFETHIKETIHPGLYIEDAVSKNGMHYMDIDRIMINYQDKNYYICAVPKNGIKEEIDPSYVSDAGQKFPSREMIEAKIKIFLQELPQDIKDGLYE